MPGQWPHWLILSRLACFPVSFTERPSKKLSNRAFSSGWMCFDVAQEPVEVQWCTPALAKPGVKGSIGLISNVPQPVCYRSMINGEIKWQTVKDLFTKNLMVSHGEVTDRVRQKSSRMVHRGSQPNNGVQGKNNTNNNHIILVYWLIRKYWTTKEYDIRFD